MDAMNQFLLPTENATAHAWAIEVGQYCILKGAVGQERPALGVSIPVPLASLHGCFGGLWTHAKCGCLFFLLSATRRPQEKREHKDGERDQSRKQIHILIGQNLCLLGYGRAHWPVVCKCCLMDKTLCLHKIDQSGNGQGGDRRTRDTQERIGSW